MAWSRRMVSQRCREHRIVAGQNLRRRRLDHEVRGAQRSRVRVDGCRGVLDHDAVPGKPECLLIAPFIDGIGGRLADEYATGVLQGVRVQRRRRIGELVDQADDPAACPELRTDPDTADQRLERLAVAAKVRPRGQRRSVCAGLTTHGTTGALDVPISIVIRIARLAIQITRSAHRKQQ